MYRESRLLLAHEYERRAFVWRLAEMLNTGVEDRRPVELRAQYGPISGWDDIVEQQRFPSSHQVEVRWQVKRQHSMLPTREFDKLLLSMLDGDFQACILTPGSFKIGKVGHTYQLHELVRRYHLSDLPEPHSIPELEGPQKAWAKHISNTVGKDNLVNILRRLQFRMVGDVAELNEQAKNALRSLYGDTQAVVDILMNYVGDKRDPGKRFTSDELFAGPLASHDFDGSTLWRGTAANLVSVNRSFKNRYSPCQKRVPIALEHGGGKVGAADAVQFVISSPCTMVTGASGAGKTCLLLYVADELSARGEVCLFVSAHRGSTIGEWLDDAAMIVGVPNFGKLLSSTAHSGRDLFVFFDSPDWRLDESTALDIKSAMHAKGVRLVLSARRSLIDDVTHIHIPSPSESEKVELWRQWAGDAPIDQDFLHALGLPVDIKIAAEARGSRPDPTRYCLIEAIVSERGVSVEDQGRLRKCAALLTEQYRSSIRTGELRRRMMLPVYSAGLLVTEGDWSYFSHDVFRVFFLASHLSLEHADPDELARAANLPRHDGTLDQLLGSPFDSATIKCLLESIHDVDLAKRVLDGQSGERAATVARGFLSQIYEIALDESRRLKIHISNGRNLVSFRCRPPLYSVLAQIRASDEWGIEKALQVAQVIRNLDDAVFSGRCSDDADFDFRKLYLLHGFRKPLAADIAVATIPEFWSDPPPTLGFRDVFAQHPRTPGLILMALHWAAIGPPPEWALSVVHDAWSKALPYNKLDAIEALRPLYLKMAPRQADEIRDFFLSRTISNPILRTVRDESLASVGAFDPPQISSLDEATAELHNLISCPTQENAPVRAASAWNLHFEFFGASWAEALESLSPSDKVTLMTLAACGLRPENADHTEIMLLGELVVAEVPETERALQIWAIAPPTQTVLIGVREECWLIATIGLCRLGLELPSPSTMDAEGRAWMAFGKLVQDTIADGDGGLRRHQVLFESLSGIEPVEALASFLRFVHCVRGSHGLLRKIDIPDFDFIKQCPRQVSQLICRALDDGFWGSKHKNQLLFDQSFFSIVTAVADNELLTWVMRLVDDPRHGVQFDAAAREIRRRP